MNTFALKHHKLTEDEIIVVVPGSLLYDEKTFELLNELQKCSFAVIPLSDDDIKEHTLQVFDGNGYGIMKLNNNAYLSKCIFDNNDDTKTFGIIISQDTQRREDIRRCCLGKFDGSVKFKIFVEEKWGRTWIGDII